MQTKKIIGIALAAALVGSMAAVAATSVSAVGVVEPGFSLEGHSVGIVGGFNEWKEDIAEMTDADGDGVYVGVVNNVAAGDTEFKIRLDGGWDYSWGMYEADYDRTFDSQTNCKISTTETTDLVVLLDTNGEDPVTWAVNYFTVENEGGDPAATYSTYGAIGGFNSWNADVAMTNYGGIYTAAIGDLEADSEFKVRADGDWQVGSWGAYEAEYDRTQNSQVNCKVTEAAKNVQVFLDTNGMDKEIWTVVFTYTNADGEIVVVNTGVNAQTAEESPEESPKEESPKEESPKEESPKEESPKEESPKEESKGPRDSTIKDYVFFDNSETKWDEVYAYWWHSDYAKTTDYKGDLWGCKEKTNEDGSTGYEPVTFPGTKMDKIEGTDIWQVKVPFGAQYMIFSSGKSDDQIKAGDIGYQSSDLKFNDVDNAGQIYTIDTSKEAVPGRGVEKTKYKFMEGAWSNYTGKFNQEKIANEQSHQSTAPAGTSTASKAAGTTNTTNTASTTSTTVDAPQTGSVAMAVAFVTIATAALGAVVLAAKKKRDEE